MRLIDADQLILDLRHRCSNETFYKQVKECLIDCAPTVDAIAVKEKVNLIQDILNDIQAEIESSEKYLREHEDDEFQRGCNRAFRRAYNIVRFYKEDNSEY